MKELTDTELLHKWVEEARKKKVKFELLWKGTRDGFKASDFHTRCDKKGPTVTIIKSQHDKIFGGFTSESWGFAPPGKGVSKHDATAFIYSLTRKEKYAQQLNRDSIREWTNRGPIFGYDPDSNDWDILICDNCNTNNSQCWANTTYQLPSGAGDDYLAGSHVFTVKEIEVYAVKDI